MHVQALGPEVPPLSPSATCKWHVLLALLPLLLNGFVNLFELKFPFPVRGYTANKRNAIYEATGIKNRSCDRARTCLVGLSRAFRSPAAEGSSSPAPPFSSLFFMMMSVSFDSFSGLRLNVKFSAKMGSVSCQRFPLVKCTFIFNLLRRAVHDRRSLEKRSRRASLLPRLNWL